MKKTLKKLLTFFQKPVECNYKLKQLGESNMAYTEKMIAQIENAQPLNLEIAKKLASDMGVSYRSIISKAKQMGFEYVAKAPAMKKAKSNEPTKADLLTSIRGLVELADRDGDLTKSELQKILEKLQ